VLEPKQLTGLGSLALESGRTDLTGTLDEFSMYSDVGGTYQWIGAVVERLYHACSKDRHSFA
jgi:hypothetical protein